jgi:Skp family chaperone for outer membrane proteins
MTDTRPSQPISLEKSHSRREILGALGAGAAMGATLLAATPAQGQNAAPLRVALVDIGVLFKQYKRKDDLENQVNAKKTQLEGAAKQQQSICEGLRKALDLATEGSAYWRDKRKELKLAVKNYEVLRDSAEEELKLEVENLTLMILDEIEEKVREYGKGTPGGPSTYDMIIKVDSKGWGDERFQERIFRAQVSSVLWYDPRLDVTNTILAALNDPAHLEKMKQRALNRGQPQGPQGPQPAVPPGPPAPPPEKK